jgi:hypothetical protein
MRKRQESISLHILLSKSQEEIKGQFVEDSDEDDVNDVKTCH